MPQFLRFPAAEPRYSVRTERRGVLRVTGKDRTAFLTRIMAGELPAAPGAARTALLGPKGNLIAAAIATVTQEAVLLECERSREQALLTALDRYRITDEVDIAPAGRGDFAIVGMDGVPVGEADSPPGWVLETAAGVLRRDFRPWPAATIIRAAVGGDGSEGVPAADRIEDEAVEASPAEEEYLRILAGEPRWDAELDERSLPLQSGLAAHVRLGRGCYVGQEYVARQAHRGRVPRLLRRLDLEDDVVPAAGAEVRFEHRSAGRVTSAVRRPEGWQGPPALALAVVSAEVTPGATVEVGRGPRAVVAEV